MKIGGWQKFSLLDFPGQVAAIVFTQGCNFRCGFCYNPMLVWPLGDSKLKYSLPKQGSQKDHFLSREDDLFAFLNSRQGKLDGVVITGGEPTLHVDLPEFIQKIRNLNLKIKLDTNGTNPQMTASLIAAGALDYLAMDVKGPAEQYEKITGVPVNLAAIRESIKIIKESGLPYEFRTTLVPGLVGETEIPGLGELVRGAAQWFLQAFRPEMELVNPELGGNRTFTHREMERMKTFAQNYVSKVGLR